MSQAVESGILIDEREQLPVPVWQLLLGSFPQQYRLASTEIMPITSTDSDPFDFWGAAIAIVLELKSRTAET
jgi:hypothetical protein